MKPKLLDLFCCQGGAGKGYDDAGFYVVGVDIAPQPRYPFDFYRGDAIEFVLKHGHEFDVITGSPPCQLYTNAQKIRKNDHPDLVAPLREALVKVGRPYVIENVPGAPLLNPVMLCGAMFGLRTYRHRLFEAGNGFSFEAPEHGPHVARSAKMGRRVKPGEYMQIVGNFTGASLAREIMEVDWMSRDGLREAIPPSYTRYIGDRLLSHIQTQRLTVSGDEP